MILTYFALPTTALLAADTSTGDGVVDALLKGGPFAIVLLLIIMDKLGTNSERDRLRVENQNLRDQNQKLNDEIRSELIPPLTEVTRIMAEAVTLLEDEERFPPAPKKRVTRRV